MTPHKLPDIDREELKKLALGWAARNDLRISSEAEILTVFEDAATAWQAAKQTKPVTITRERIAVKLQILDPYQPLEYRLQVADIVLAEINSK